LRKVFILGSHFDKHSETRLERRLFQFLLSLSVLFGLISYTLVLTAWSKGRKPEEPAYPIYDVPVAEERGTPPQSEVVPLDQAPAQTAIPVEAAPSNTATPPSSSNPIGEVVPTTETTQTTNPVETPSSQELPVTQSPPASSQEPSKVTTPPPAVREYRVWIWQENGDCLWRIAEKVYGDRHKWNIIYLANKDILKSPHKIYPNQKLQIPPADWQPPVSE